MGVETAIIASTLISASAQHRARKKQEKAAAEQAQAQAEAQAKAEAEAERVRQEQLALEQKARQEELDREEAQRLSEGINQGASAKGTVQYGARRGGTDASDSNDLLVPVGGSTSGGQLGGSGRTGLGF